MTTDKDQTIIINIDLHHARDDLISIMSSRDKEVFERYKDTYPFPIEKFIEEIGVESINKRLGTENIYYTIPIDNIDKPLDTKCHNFGLCMHIVNYIISTHYNDKIFLPYIENMVLTAGFLAPPDKIFEASKKFKTPQKISKHFGVPLQAFDMYAERLNQIIEDIENGFLFIKKLKS